MIVLTRSSRTPTAWAELAGICLLWAAVPVAAQSPPADARDTAGRFCIIGDDAGPADCPLEHTEVRIDVAGFVATTTVKQTFRNPLDRKIEAVYTFPLPQHAAVDDMTMIIGERRIEAEIQPRDQARETYERARAAGHVASLLDQERTNIFTQAVANIEPGVRIDIEIRYVDTLAYDDGWFTLTFPTVVGPRCIPGGGSAPAPLTRGGGTPQVPDGTKITPPVAPQGTRAGHDLDITVSIDGGLPIETLRSAVHAIEVQRDGPDRAVVRLADQETIPNRDFVLEYKLAGGDIGSALLTHSDERGRFFTLILQPPERVAPQRVVPRELVFVLDTSGSMNGQPIEKAKHLMARMIDTMGPGDTFNLITFAGDTHILWESPRSSTRESIAAAQEFLLSRQGGGGTEMMKAIEAALVQTRPAQRVETLAPRELVNLPADGRRVLLRLDFDQWAGERGTTDGFEVPIDSRTILRLDRTPQATDVIRCATGVPLYVVGRWATVDGARLLEVEEARWEPQGLAPLRVVVFMTDGYVGNDLAIVDAVKQNADTTRVFGFGIGNSVNRFLLDAMSHAGRGEVEYVMLSNDADAAVERFHERVLSPVLTHVELDWHGTGVTDVYPTRIPDLFAARPILVHGRLTGDALPGVTLRGRTGAGPFERTIDGAAAERGAHPGLASLWARAQVEELMNRDLAALQAGNFPDELERQITTLGVAYRLMTPFTSFVAVERLRVTSGGEPITIDVPVEMPDGVTHEGVFGEPATRRIALGQGGGRFGGAVPPMPATAAPAQNGRALQALGYAGSRLEEAEADTIAVRQADEPADPLDKLDETLRKLVVRIAQQGADGLEEFAGIPLRDGRVELVIALRTIDDGVRRALEQLGVEVRSEAAAAPVLIVTMPVEHLEALAKLDAVQRIRPLRKQE